MCPPSPLRTRALVNSPWVRGMMLRQMRGEESDPGLTDRELALIMEIAAAFDENVDRVVLAAYRHCAGIAERNGDARTAIAIRTLVREFKNLPRCN